MKKYITLDDNYQWQNLFHNITDDYLFLLNTGDGDFILAWGKEKALVQMNGAYNAKELQSFIDENNTNYFFSYLSYDIKNNATRNLTRFDDQKDNDLIFLIPSNVLIKKKDQLTYFGEKDKVEITTELTGLNAPFASLTERKTIKLQGLTSESDYLTNLINIKERIQAGILYEMNYCIQFSETFSDFDPHGAYLKLFENAKAPFSSFVKHGDQYIIGASPERFIQRRKDILYSQPIKGTAKRGKSSIEDEQILADLTSNTKEISENVMIVDLVRNDLSQIAEKNSVKVDELCKPYTFRTVHQLISKISCQLRPLVAYTDILEALFPMGSMTGAPKVSAIKNIDHFENFSRGIYSGSIGYIEPNGNMDFNVVIRTIFADMKKQLVSSSVGGAITINSDPVKEFEECLLKLNAIEKTLC